MLSCNAAIKGYRLDVRAFWLMLALGRAERSGKKLRADKLEGIIVRIGRL